MIFLKIWAAMLFEPEQTWLHEVISECEKQQTSDIQSVLYYSQWLQLSGSDNFGFFRCSPEEHISINYEIILHI
jgi:hypothetical protein